MNYLKFYNKIENKYLNIITKIDIITQIIFLIWNFNICKYYSNFNYKFYLNTIMKAYHIENLKQLKFFVNNYKKCKNKYKFINL